MNELVKKAKSNAEWLQKYDEWLVEFGQKNSSVVVGEAIDILEAAEARRQNSPNVFDQMHPRFWLGDADYSPISNLTDSSHDFKTVSLDVQEQMAITPTGIKKTKAGRGRSFVRLRPTDPVSASTFRSLRLWISSLDAKDIGLHDDSGTQRIDLVKLLSCARGAGKATPHVLNMEQAVDTKVNSRSNTHQDAREKPLVTLPPGTKWPSITIRFQDGETVKVKVAGGEWKNYLFSDLGMSTTRKRPSKDWKLLRKFSEQNGHMEQDRIQKRSSQRAQISSLSKALRSAFGIVEAPITPEKNSSGWYTRFKLESENRM